MLPVGCYEQHGPILPLATDSLIAERLAAELGQRLGDCHVLPPVHFTPTAPNLDYPGTVHVDNDVARAYLRAVLEAVLVTPYARLIVVNAHGSVSPVLKEVGFAVVMRQFREGIRPLRPVLCLDVFDFREAVLQRYGQLPGRHADWTEFLLTFAILGRGYYHQERLRHFEEFTLAHNFELPQPGVLGIPLQYRSVQGVQGNPRPPAHPDLDVQAADYLQFVAGLLEERVGREMAEFARVTAQSLVPE